MDNSIKTGQYFLSLLEANNDLIEMLGTDKIFPLIAKEGTQYPLVIYTRDNLTVRYTKPMYGGWDNTVQISYRIYSDKYDEALEIANLIRATLEAKEYEDEDIKINLVQLVNSNEAFGDDAFIQQLTFQTMVE